MTTKKFKSFNETLSVVLVIFLKILCVNSQHGYVFVRHLNNILKASDVAPILRSVLNDNSAVEVLLENESNIPTFNGWHNGLKSKQSWERYQHTIASLFLWPNGDRNAAFDPPYVHDRPKMLNKIRNGINGYDSHSLVIHPDLMFLFGKSMSIVPEYIYEGVWLWASEASKNNVRTLLVMPDLENAGIVVGIADALQSLGVEIVPVGVAFNALSDALKQKTSNAIMPALEASCIFFLDGNASDPQITISGLSQGELQNIFSAARTAVDEIKNYQNMKDYASYLNVSIPEGGGASWFGSIKSRNLRYETWGTSTENGLRNNYANLLPYGGMTSSYLGNSNKGSPNPSWKGTEANPSDVMLKRSMASGPGPDDYFPNGEEVKRYHIWMKFDYQYDKQTSAYGDWNVQTMDSSYFGSVWNAMLKVVPMRSNDQKANFFPTRWFIAEEAAELPYPNYSKVLSDSTHLSNAYLQGVSSGMLTLITGGRCFVGDEPTTNIGNDAWQKWHTRKTGYMMAWRLATLKPRAPFLEVRPPSSNSNANSFPYGTQPWTEGLDPSITIRLLEAPEDDVQIIIEAVGDGMVGAVDIYPSVVTILASGNYKDPIGVYIVTSGRVEEGTNVPVRFKAFSNDVAFENVEDVWTFTTTEAPDNIPTYSPISPTLQPSTAPSKQPTTTPSIQPSAAPSMDPSTAPSKQPSATPSKPLSTAPSIKLSTVPSMKPSAAPSMKPSTAPSKQPSTTLSKQPSTVPSMKPSTAPSMKPSAAPSKQPSTTTSMKPSTAPSTDPSAAPSMKPSTAPSNKSISPTTFEIKSMNNMCLTPKSSGSSLLIKFCKTKNLNQKWFVDDMGRIRNVAMNKKCVVKSGSFAALIHCSQATSSKLVTWEYSSFNQKIFLLMSYNWVLKPAELSNGKQVKVVKRSNSETQTWNIRWQNVPTSAPLSSGTFQITSRKKWCLTPKLSNSPLVINTCESEDTKWFVDNKGRIHNSQTPSMCIVRKKGTVIFGSCSAKSKFVKWEHGFFTKNIFLMLKTSKALKPSKFEKGAKIIVVNRDSDSDDQIWDLKLISKF